MDEVRSFQIGGDDISADSEPLILVDEGDREVGHMSKAQCHQGGGVLHRSFSLLIFASSCCTFCLNMTICCSCSLVYKLDFRIKKLEGLYVF